MAWLTAKQLRLLLTVMVVLSVAAVFGCGGGSKPGLSQVAPGTGEVAPVRDNGPFGLPTPSYFLGKSAQSRQVSNAASPRFNYAGEYVTDSPLGSQRVSMAGDSMNFEPQWDPTGTPQMADLSYCVYMFQLTGYDGPVEIGTQWSAPPEADDLFWFGLGDVANDRWAWHPYKLSAGLDVDSFAPYTNSSGQLVMAVVGLGTRETTLDWIRLGDNIPPIVNLTATPTSGIAPVHARLEINESYDLDGQIVRFFWDWESDGTIDALTTGVEPVFHDFTASGAIEVTVRADDDDGASSTDSVTINIAAGNEPPVAVIKADTTFGSAPLTVNLDGSDSYEIGGTIARYEWDLDGDGTYETDTSTTATAQTVVNSAGSTTLRLRVTDDDDQTGTDQLTVTINAAGYDEVENNEAANEGDHPSTFANALPSQGFSGFEANLGVGGYDGDFDDWYSVELDEDYQYTITMDGFVHADADLDMQLFASNGTTQVASSTTTNDGESFSFAPSDSGTYYLRCYVFQEDPEMSDYVLGMSRTAVVPIIATFVPTPNTGARMLTVNFDASGSNDPGGGTITSYQWDFDGDGRIDFTKTNTSTDPALATGYYYAVGNFNATLTVKSDSGAQSTVFQEITVTGSADNEQEPNNAAPGQVNTLPAFPITGYWGHVGPKAVPDGDPGDENDWFRFTLASRQDVSITLEFFDSVCDIDMRLFDGSIGFENDDALVSSTGIADTENISTTLDPGTYYIKVYAYTGVPAQGGYKLTGTSGPPTG